MQKEKLIIQVWLQTGITEGCYTLGCSLPPLMSFTCGRRRTCRDKPRIPHITELLLARNLETLKLSTAIERRTSNKFFKILTSPIGRIDSNELSGCLKRHGNSLASVSYPFLTTIITEDEFALWIIPYRHEPGKPIARSKCLIVFRLSSQHTVRILACSNKHLLLVHPFGQSSCSKIRGDPNADFSELK